MFLELIIIYYRYLYDDIIILLYFVSVIDLLFVLYKILMLCSLVGVYNGDGM